jgi:hypothetical protein
MVLIGMSNVLRSLDECPFTRKPCGVSDLCWSAMLLLDGDDDVVKECSPTTAGYLVREHLLYTKLCPFSDKPCASVKSCDDAFRLLSGFAVKHFCSLSVLKDYMR